MKEGGENTMSKYHAQEDEENYTPNTKLDDETNREFTHVYHRLNWFVKLYNLAMLRILDLEEENRNLKQGQMNLETEMRHIRETLGTIHENTKWTSRAVKQGLIGGMITATFAFILFLIQRGF